MAGVQNLNEQDMVLPLSRLILQKRKKKIKMECQATETKIGVLHKGFRGSQSACGPTLLVFISSGLNNTGRGDRREIVKLEFHLKAQIHNSNSNCSLGEN